MSALKVALVLFALVALAAAKTWTVGAGEHIPAQWERLQRAPVHAQLQFTIALKSRNIPLLQEILSRVSDPDHKDYGKWLTLDQINAMTEPVEGDKQRLEAWLAKYNVQGRITGDSILCQATVSAASAMFGTRFFLFQKTDEPSRKLVRSLGSYSVSDDVSDLIVFVSGLVNFPKGNRYTFKSREVDPKQDNTNGVVVPEVIRDFYSIPFTYRVNENSSICLAEFQSLSSFNATDLHTFQVQTDDVVNPVASNHIIGPYKPFPPAGESSLDVEYGGGLALNASVWFWTTTGWMYDFAVQFLQTPTVPFIVSMSWGAPENEQCDIGTCSGINSEQYINQTEGVFLKITLRGVTILAATGDTGAPGDGNPNCLNTITPITTSYPASSQYALAVGATAIQEPPSTGDASPTDVTYSSPVCQQFKCATGTTEIVCSYPNALITSGGGFSMYIPQPAWQATAVNTYIGYNRTGQVYIPDVRYVNVNNRGYPDVSALGHNYLIYLTNILKKASWSMGDGTSASTPVWGGIISLFNDIRQNQKKPTLGFVNPAIYKAWAQNKLAINDITTGNNNCTETCCSKYGFQAYVGWDPVTGLGTPNYPPLAQYFLNLP